MRILTIIFLLCTSSLLAQQVQWANKVIGYSSQLTVPNQATENTANQILGAPSILPNFGLTVCAWQPAVLNNPADDWIKVSFDSVQTVRQIIIAENYGQGFIKQVYLYDLTGKEYLVHTEGRSSTTTTGRLLHIIFKKPTEYKVSALRILVNTGLVKGPNQIDAVGISGSEVPFVPKINVEAEYTKVVIKENLGLSINSRAHEAAPVISPDGKTLYFTRWNHPENIGEFKLQDVWMSQYLNGAWQPAKNLGIPINNDDNNAACSISTDGKTLYLINVYLPDGRNQKGISSSHLGRGWSFPKQLKVKNYINYSPETEFAVGANGKVMIIAAERRDTKGGKDLYFSFQNNDSTWTEPKTLGPVINTAASESTPFLASDSKTLYFSTFGYPGYGKDDIFMSKRLDETWQNWSEPVNLGPNINTNEWDGYFTIPANGEYAYLVSLQNSIGNEDIFRIRLPEINKPEAVAFVTGQVTENKTNTNVAATVYAVSVDAKKDTLKAEYQPETGDYKLILDLKKKYVVFAKKSDYLSTNETIDLTKELNYKEIKRNLTLTPIEAGLKAQLKELVFQQSSYDLVPSSYGELDKIAEMMQENTKLEIHLDGHTDNQGDWNANMKLSENRVLEVKKYLISKGIAAKRITTKAWGGSRAISSNETEATRMKNRRVEFTIKKK